LRYGQKGPLIWLPLVNFSSKEGIDEFLTPARRLLALRANLYLLNIALGCDTPILESIFWCHPLRPL
jgi:hypothetical protein